MRCGYVALLGAPNVGKSTLLNRLVGAKVSIVTPKVQTTRNRVLGIAVTSGDQIVYVDTPGIFTPQKRLDRAMVAAAWGGAADADVVVVLADAKRGLDADSGRIVAGLAKAGRRALLALNKIELVRRETLLQLSERFNKEGAFEETFMISALGGDGVDTLLEAIRARLPAGPWLFPEDQLTDMPQRLMAAEVTREKAFLQLHQELPYAIDVETDSWSEQDNGEVRVEQTVYVRRDSQKAIVLGKGGSRIKAIGSAARADLEEMFGHKLHLFLHVKVRENWPENRAHYRERGLDFDA
ncbi:MAG: GTPase Era [Alphaproteobacteria bacterium]|nr:GTPase Era [Alphaproteobacteria bacterium]